VLKTLFKNHEIERVSVTNTTGRLRQSQSVFSNEKTGSDNRFRNLEHLLNPYDIE
jgi:hypothetical protein